MTTPRQRITSKSWKMDKQTKRFLATIGDKHARADFRKIMINGQVASEVIVKSRAERESADKK
jgi:hypothetical protein